MPKKNKNKKQNVKLDKNDSQEALLKSQLARALADYDNFAKRVEKEREQMSVIVKTRFLTNLLPALDMLYDAQNHLQDVGLAMAIQTFEAMLSDEGFEKIPVENGDAFDESCHEAIEMVQKNDTQSGTIHEVVLTGWRRKDGALVRATKVKVVG